MAIRILLPLALGKAWDGLISKLSYREIDRHAAYEKFSRIAPVAKDIVAGPRVSRYVEPMFLPDLQGEITIVPFH
jgi:hypothetical protein